MDLQNLYPHNVRHYFSIEAGAVFITSKCINGLIMSPNIKEELSSFNSLNLMYWKNCRSNASFTEYESPMHKVLRAGWSIMANWSRDTD